MMSLLSLGAAPAAPAGKSLLDHLASGGPIGFVIILLSFVGVVLVIMHLVSVREGRLAPPHVIDELARRLQGGDIKGATEVCQHPDNDSFVTRVFAAALIRCRRSPFGLLELRTALEEAGQQQVSRLYRSTDGIGLIASVAPMLGLLGTVVGMVGAFDTISMTEGFARPDQLAGDISQALITTVLGLIVAIPATAVFTFFRNRIDAMTSGVGDVIEDLAALVENQNQSGPGQQRPGGAGAARRPAPQQQPQAGGPGVGGRAQ